MQYALHALLLVTVWSLLTPSLSVPVSIDVPLTLGEVVAFKQGSDSAIAFTRTYNSVPQEQDLAKANFGVFPTSSFNVVFNPRNQSITFGDIAIKNLTGDLIAVHIHGPCAPSLAGLATPCNAPVVYTICHNRNNRNCPAGRSPTIPSFVVDITQLDDTSATNEAVGLFQDIMHGSNLYYVNFHTPLYKNGEIRADLVVPQGSATIEYDTQSVPTKSTIGGGSTLNNTNTLLIPAKVTIRLVGMTGNPTAIHLHGSASRGITAPAMVWLCHSGNCPPTLPVPNAGSVISFPTSNSYSAVFTNVAFPLGLVFGRSTYLNVHTNQFLLGEVRGQIRPTTSFPKTGPQITRSFGLSVYQENARIVLSYTATPQQHLPPAFISSCASASFNVTFEPTLNPIVVTFSSISITGGLSGPLTAAHIHGPCPNRVPCDAPVVYLICGGQSTPCPPGTTPTIPGFNVNPATLASADGSTLIGLLADILSGNNLYYVNFHTAMYPDGEIRANLKVPRGSATLTYNPSTSSQFSYNLPSVTLYATNASLTVTVDKTMTGPVTAAHLHGPSPDGVNSGVFIPLCGDTPCYLGNNNVTRVFENVGIPLKLLNQGMMYLNLHTDANPTGGEIRGQLVTEVAIPNFQTSGIVSYPSTPNFENAAEILYPDPSVPISFSVPLYVGQSHSGGPNAPNTTLRYTATPQQEGSNSIAPSGCPVVQTPLPMAEFSISINPGELDTNTIRFSTITVTGLRSNLTAAHIHGPCLFQRCNAAVAFTIPNICNSSTCNLASIQIPGFEVSSQDFSTSSLLSGEAFFYVNIHTVNNPAGELRADLVIPRGTATVTYTRTSVLTSITTNNYPRISAVPATVSVSLTGLTSSVTAMHLHGPAGFGRNTNVLVDICTSEGACGMSPTSSIRTFNINWPINVAAMGSTYFNVHTLVNPGGEVRGQVVRQISIPDPISNGNGGTLTFNLFTDSLCTQIPDANATRTLPLIGESLIPGLGLPVWGIPNPFVATLNSCTPYGFRLGSNGQPLIVYTLVSQCSLQGAGAILATFSDNACEIPFTPAELFPAGIMGQCVQIFSPFPNIAPSGLFIRETCSGNVTIRIPVSVYQENTAISLNFLQRGTPGQQIPQPSQSCANADFVVFQSFNPADQRNDIAFTSITMRGLSGPLTSAHIHGPCPNNVPCNAGVIYHICGASGAPPGVSACPSGIDPTIPSFTVNRAQNVSSDNSILVGLYSDILSGNNLYYVNFHTAMYPDGEIRANLKVPRGSATLTYNPSTATASSILATIQISVVSSTGPVTAVHVHAEALNGFNGVVVVPLCGAPLVGVDCSLDNGQVQTFSDVLIPLPFIRLRNAYLNFHTDENRGGELRGQIMSFMTPPPSALVPAAPAPAPASNMNTVTFALSSYQEAVVNSITLPFTATFAQEVFVLDGNGMCTPPTQAPIGGKAVFNVVFSPQGTVSFSAINVSGLSSDLVGAHIHGPCTSTPCNANVIYHICGGQFQTDACPTGANTIIPAFTVNTTQSSNLQLDGFYHRILSGSVFYYVNLHTRIQTGGELRANLILPQGSVTVSYDPSATPAPVTLQSFTNVLAIPASVTISLTGMTSVPMTIHLHEPAGFTNNAGVLVPICGQPLVVPCLLNGGTQTFESVNLPVRLLNGNLPSLGAWPYWNVHTTLNSMGEVRGRLVQTEDFPSTTSLFTRAANTLFTDAACTRLSVDLQRQNAAPFAPMATPSDKLGMPNPVLWPINQCVPALVPNVWERVSLNGCDGDSVKVIQYRDSSCIQIRGVQTFSKQCTPLTLGSVTLYARATCSAQALPPNQSRRPFTSTVPLNVLQLHPGSISFTYTATANNQPPPAFVSSCARATFSVTFVSSDRSISFSNIDISGLSGDLGAAYIHGPCPLPSGVIGSEEGFVPCNAPPIYDICNGPCPSGANLRIPAFTVAKSRPWGDIRLTDGSFLIGLYESILSGSNMYYVNFVTSKFPAGEIRTDLLVPYGMADITISTEPQISSSVTIRLQNLRGMPNSIRLFNAVSYKDPREPPFNTLCSGSASLGSTPITNPLCNAADLKANGLFSFRQTFSSIPFTNLDSSRFSMAMFVATTAVAFPGELRGQLAQTYQDLMHTPPVIPIPPSPSPVPSSVLSTTVPLDFGQVIASVQYPRTRVYTATSIATGSCIITASGATFTLTLTSPKSIALSDIVITRLNSALTAVHIHGPCLRGSSNNDGASCNANVIFTICGPPSNRPCPLTNAIGALTIPGITIDQSTLQQFNLYQNMVNGLNLYYVNFHTNANPNGELRANLVLPRGSATITYDTAAVPVLSTFSEKPLGLGSQLSVRASIEVTLTGLTGSVVQAWLRGPAFFGASGNGFLNLCSPNTPLIPCSALSALGVFTQTFTNVTIPNVLLEDATASIELNTAAYPNPGNGEARGQLARVINPTTASGINVGTSSLDMRQESTKTSFSFTANSAQNVGVNVPSQASASFDITFGDPIAPAIISISPIIVQGLTSELQAIHIHGPCFGICNAPVVAVICGPPGNRGRMTPCPALTSATVSMPIPAPENLDGLLYHSILRADSRALYYVNFHTRLYPDGEIRANIAVPTGVFTYQYNVDASVSPSSSVTLVNASVLLTGLSGPPTAIHIHGFSAIGVSADVLVPLCGPPLLDSCTLPTSNTESSSTQFVFQRSFQVPVAQSAVPSFGSAYINVHTAKNPMGEVRAQLALILPLPPLRNLLAVTPVAPPATSSPPPANPANPGNNVVASGDSATLSGGSIAGIVIGSILGTAVVVLASWFGYKRFQNRFGTPGGKADGAEMQIKIN